MCVWNVIIKQNFKSMTYKCKITYVDPDRIFMCKPLIITIFVNT